MGSIMATQTVTEQAAPAPTLQLSGNESYFWMGPGTHKVPMSMHKLNRQRLFERFAGCKGSILVQGGKQKMRHSSDNEPLFRQESYFQWLFGVMEADCFGILNLDTGASILFIPRLAEEYAIWMGEIKTREHFRVRYEVDEVHFVDEIPLCITEAAASKVYLLQGVNSDSRRMAKPAKVEGVVMEGERFDLVKLHKEMSELRTIKTPQEIQVLKYAARVSSEAHVECMRKIKAGLREYQMEATFLHYAYYNGGCRHVGYTCICPSGKGGSILHYGHAGAPNDGIIRDGDMVLYDMGAEYHCYGADITCSFPVNGKFTEQQRDIYTAVLTAQEAVFSQLRPGVNWTDMHKAAERGFLTVLTERGYLRGDIDEMMEKRIGALFQPHGLGHMLGIDTHDVGGYLEFNPPRSTERGLAKLRTTCTVREGMYMTVEPGVYFISALLEPAFNNPEEAKFLNEEKIRPMMNFGGVRLEDDVVITADGFENFTRCPRKIEDIEAVMAGAKWDFDTNTVVSD